MDIRQIVATEKVEECWALLESHREELTTHKHIMILKPDMVRYKAMEDQGCVYTLALYDEDKIVGYSVTMTVHNLHYSDLIVAQNDIIFVHKDYRGSAWGIRLIAETERIAKERGAGIIVFHGKKDTAFSEIMPRLGYTIQDMMFSKEL